MGRVLETRRRGEKKCHHDPKVNNPLLKDSYDDDDDDDDFVRNRRKVNDCLHTGACTF